MGLWAVWGWVSLLGWPALGACVQWSFEELVGGGCGTI